MCDGPPPGCGPDGCGPTKFTSGAGLCGLAVAFKAGPLDGMPTHPATEATTAASTHMRRRARTVELALLPMLATGHQLFGGIRFRGTQAGRDLRLVRAERQRGAREFLPDHPGQGQPEHRALARLAPGLQPAARQAR